MNLQQYFRLITMSIFQKELTDIATYLEQEFIYDRVYFKCPRIYCKDGFNLSVQINSLSYSSSNNGYQKLGYTWKTCEFGYPSENDDILLKYSEDRCYDMITVGSIPVKELQKVLDNHGGIDLDETLSEVHYNMIVEGRICLKKL